MIAVLAAAVVLVLAAAGGYYFIYDTDKHQISEVMNSWADAYNKDDVAGAMKLSCSQLVGGGASGAGLLAGMAGAAADAELRTTLEKTGPISVSVGDVHVTGDKATASLTVTAAKNSEKQTVTAPFVKENGDWKYCPADK